MKLRWFIVCYDNGKKDAPELQYWDEHCLSWVTVGYVECKTWEIDDYNRDPTKY